MSDDQGPPADLARWEARCVDDELPWDTGIPDEHLRRFFERFDLGAGRGLAGEARVLESGCGTGTNAIWLAQHGFDVCGLDHLSPTAIERACAKAEAAHVSCDWQSGDIFVDAVPGGPFDLVYDRGCFHCFDDPALRSRFATRVAEFVQPAGLRLSVIGSTDGPPREVGPPRRSATAVLSAVEPCFELLELTASTFDDDRLAYARAWLLVAHRRDPSAA